MRRLRFDSIFRCCSIVLLAGWFHCAQAAELGEAAVRSYIGQPLVADVELSALADPAAQVAVRNAHADVYRGANIALNPVLSSLAFSVVRRDGRQFVHITSVRPVESDYVHLFLELTEGNKRNIRPVTLWLTADPSPPPPSPKPVPPPAPVIAKPVPAPAPPAPPVSRAEPEEPAPVRKPVRVITLGQAPAACAVSEEKLKSCAETDYKNGLLSAQVVELEEKVRQLQMIVDAKTPAPAAALPPPAAPKKPAVPPPPAKKAPAEPAGGFPWLLVAGLVLGLAVLGGGAWFLLKGGKVKTAEATEPAAADAVPWFRRLAARLRRKPKVEPEKIPPEA